MILTSIEEKDGSPVLFIFDAKVNEKEVYAPLCAIREGAPDKLTLEHTSGSIEVTVPEALRGQDTALFEDYQTFSREE